VFTKCDAARIALKASDNATLEELFGQIAKRLGLTSVAIPDEGFVDDGIDEYADQFDEIANEVQYFIGVFQELSESLSLALDDLLALLPKILTDDDVKAEAFIVSILRKAFQKIAGKLLFFITIVRKTRDKVLEIEEKLANLLNIIEKVRNSIKLANDLRKMKVIDTLSVEGCRS
jgi:hypothetical protein